MQFFLNSLLQQVAFDEVNLYLEWNLRDCIHGEELELFSCLWH